MSSGMWRTKIFLVLSTIFFCLVFSHFSQAAPVLKTSQPLPREILIELSLDGLGITTLVEEGGTYHQVIIQGFGLGGETGRPELPFRGMFFEIPYGVEPKGKVLKQEWKSFKVDHPIYPRQPLQRVSPNPPPIFTMDRNFYQTSHWSPSVIFSISNPGYLRGRRIVFVQIYPVQYNPAKGEVRYTQVLKIKINLLGKIEPFGEARKARLYAPGFNTLSSRLLDNYDQANLDLEDRSHPRRVLSQEGQEGFAVAESPHTDYLIIVDSSLKPAIQPLAEWITRKGYTTRMATVGDSPEDDLGRSFPQIQGFLQDAYDTWTPAPSFVLLVGDQNLVPSNTDSFPFAYDNANLSDFPYSLMDGDIFADLVLGRLPVENAAELTTVVNKILKYDRYPDTGSWYKNVLLATTYRDASTPCKEELHNVETSIYMTEALSSSTVAGMTVSHALSSVYNTYGLPPSPTCPEYYYRDYAFTHCLLPHGYWNGPPYPPFPMLAWVKNLFVPRSVASQMLKDQINSGVGMVQYYWHSSTSSWLEPQLGIPNINSLSNGDKTPVVLSMGCSTGAFDSASDCMAEAFLKKSGGGAVGIVAATRGTYTRITDMLINGIHTGLWPNYDPGHTGSLYPNSYRPAENLNFGKYYMWKYFQSEPNPPTLPGRLQEIEYHFRVFHWFGDPLMMIRTEAPHALVVSHAPTIPSNASSFPVNVDQEGARVALVQNWRVLGVAEPAGGIAVVPLDPPLRADTVYLTITGFNAIPYETALAVALTSDGIVSWDKESYGIYDPAGILLGDLDLAGSHTLAVHVWSSSHPALVPVALTEDAVHQGYFAGEVILSLDLPTVEGDTILVEYLDANDGQGGVDVFKLAEASISPSLIYRFALNSDPGWTKEGGWAYGKPQGLGSSPGDPTSGETGTKVYGYNLSGDYPDNLAGTESLITTPINLQLYDHVRLRFWRWLVVQSSNSDHASLEVSKDGSNWVPVWGNPATQISDSAWTQVEYDLSAVADDQRAVYLRWGMGPTDGSITYPGWNLDDIELWGHRLRDSDADGLSDFFESGFCTDPHNPDTDGDALSDGQEYNSSGTNPCLMDTDGDGMDDGWEVNYAACVDPLVGDSLADPDADLLSNLFEYQQGLDPCVSYACQDGLDNDGDGLTDLADPGCSSSADPSELGVNQCDDNLDNDGDGLKDYPEDPDCSSVADISEGLDSDGDNLPDSWENLYGCMQANTADGLLDYDLDSLSNEEEFSWVTDPCAPDTDGDLMGDQWEVFYRACLDPLTANGLEDPDADGLANVQEYFNDVDANVSDPCDGTKPRQGAPGAGYFGDADGNLVIGVPDLNIINLQLNGRHPDYSRVFPPDPIVQDLDGNLVIGVPDKNLISLILNGKLTDYITGSPTELSLVAPIGGATVSVGDTVRIKVKLTKDLTKPRAGFGVVFTIVSGAGTLLGGEGISGSGRYDLTALDGVAQMVVRADAAGTILVHVELPYDGEVHTRQVTMPDVPIDVLP